LLVTSSDYICTVQINQVLSFVSEAYHNNSVWFYEKNVMVFSKKVPHRDLKTMINKHKCKICCYIILHLYFHRTIQNYYDRLQKQNLKLDWSELYIYNHLMSLTKFTVVFRYIGNIYVYYMYCKTKFNIYTFEKTVLTIFPS
jgi:hypothetical protein